MPTQPHPGLGFSGHLCTFERRGLLPPLFTPKLAFWSSGVLAFPSQQPLAELQHLREGKAVLWIQGPPVGNQGRLKLVRGPGDLPRVPRLQKGAGPSSP